MDVAHLVLARARWCFRRVQQGDFDHAVDNISDSAGFVADWVAGSHRWRPHPPAAGSGSDYPDHQPRDWSKGSLIPATKRRK